jgi:hypothetical protein
MVMTLSSKEQVCVSAAEVVYSNKIHIIFRILHIKIGPEVNILIQKIWEKDTETIINNEKTILVLIEKFQLIKKYIEKKDQNKGSFSEAIYNLWEYVIPVVEANIQYALEQNQNNDVLNKLVPVSNTDSIYTVHHIQDSVSQMIYNNIIPLDIQSTSFLLKEISTKIENGSTVHAQELILNIDNLDVRVRILIQLTIQEIEKGRIEYAKHFCEQAVDIANELHKKKDICVIMCTVFRLQKVLYNQKW